MSTAAAVPLQAAESGAEAAPTQAVTAGLPVIYGAMHMLVDLTTVTAITRAAGFAEDDLLGPFGLVLGYDLLAFGLQLPLGYAVDRLGALRGALVAGLALSALGLGLVPYSAAGTMVVAGVGNALFHLGAGALVLVGARGRAAPTGVFVAPGALGLGLGMALGRAADLPTWPLFLVLAAAIVAAGRVRNPRPQQPLNFNDQKVGAFLSSERAALWWTVLGLVFASVMVRSFVGFASARGCPKSLVLLAGIPLAGFLGKTLGGLVSDRVGWVETSVGALVLSAPMIALAGYTPWGLLPGLVIFQATMPVTLTAAYLLMPRYPATAFGLPCLGLVLGALPTFFDDMGVYARGLFLALIL
ncbi:MAG: hypothetical protein HY902_14275, partial [Deltaproteobacteria bacterium]|nr:hypothetical protein [Deltaproteobacteria bacterium]